MLISEIITFVQTSLDSDSDELPDALCLVWVQEAFNRIMHELVAAGVERGYQTKAATAGTSTLSLTTAVSDIQQVVGPSYTLEPISFERGLDMFPLNATEASASVTGQPIYWSRMPNSAPNETTSKIWLWPAPSSADTYGVWYALQSADASAYTTSSTPGVPKVFMPLIGEYLCARGYELQQNAQMAVVKMNRFEAELDLLAREFARASKAQTITIGGERSTHLEVPSRLRFSWE